MSLIHLQQMGISKTNIKPVLNDYTIESSTESKTDCIYGSINLVIYLLNNMGKFFESTIEFLIANDTIKMTDIILGTQWLRKHNASLNLKKILH